MIEARLFRPNNFLFEGLISDYPLTLREALFEIKEISVKPGDCESDVFTIDADFEQAKEMLKELNDLYQEISKKRKIKAPELNYLI